MNAEITGITAIFVITVLLAIPLGKYIAKVFLSERTGLDFLAPVENFVYRICRINPLQSMDWRENTKAMLVLNLVFFVWAMLVLLTQSWHPFWNPDSIASMEPTTAFNTAVSFMTNTNLQHYSGETGASYLTQLLVFCFLQFVSAATGIAAMALLFKGIMQRQVSDLGNFYVLFLKSCTRILLPISIVVAIFLVFRGTPSTFEGSARIVSLQGDTVNVARGPVATMVAIKQVGTNGGGYFGPNSTHPFENPDYLTNAVENFAILIIPIALVFAFGYYIRKPKVGYSFFAAMTFVFVSFVAVTVYFESKGNPMITEMGIDNSAGSMEGKEVRLGPAASALWGVSTTSTSNGSVNSMHDSQTPLSGGVYTLDMMINAIYGGVGVGFINFFVFVIIAVFISGLMVGRTPELLGKKIEAKEVKIAALVAILHPLLILTGTAIASYVQSNNPDIGWLANPSFHGFSEMLYEFTSSAANNGSGFEGLGDATPFWNILCGLCMLFGRFIPIIGPLAIAGSLAGKKYVPEGAGTLKIESPAFIAVLLSVIIIIAALSFFPALALGPLAEYFSM
ncbi:MAG TPA: potassium-transporting ATPase subunit KdpA [Cyclobacteriaceae bacterium]|nr:potassium-transporting ATPase subunit KdpA [Cyclobacteriaceae bacterium]HMV10185.1 potassium-transporting ATPase subunit KdpA [Cyclobacteriaceae bacterium]HMV90969.1 potassium-transporting ATPase subunit KdpA [Cyclobacteriaceae bacterium]HMX01522.1 potassium-transporting ATPase subunit KdpA [Cyclobacteriaceae bacterium]HMX51476.1 potassium-transporting ATPase subunit KdpA [Cyclobacteriaceae bacterium]